MPRAVPQISRRDLLSPFQAEEYWRFHSLSHIYGGPSFFIFKLGEDRAVGKGCFPVQRIAQAADGPTTPRVLPAHTGKEQQ